MKDRKMTGDTGKYSPRQSSSSFSHQKNRSESGINPPSVHNSGASGDSKSTKSSSNSPITAPSKLQLYSIPSSVPGTFPPVGDGAPSPFRGQNGIAQPAPVGYGFHMLERRTMVLADGRIRSYFALPPDYQDLPVDSAEPFVPLETESHGLELGSPGLGFEKGFCSSGSSSPEGFSCDPDEMYGGGGEYDHCNSPKFDGFCPIPLEGSLKRKYGDEDVQQKQQFLEYGNPSSNPSLGSSGAGDRDEYAVGTSSSPFSQDSLDVGQEIDDLRSSKHMKFGGDSEDSQLDVPSDDVSLEHPDSLKKAFLQYAKLVNEDASRKKNYLENGKHEPLHCLACGRGQILNYLFLNALDMPNSRDSKDFPDMHDLIIHTYNSQNSRVDHLGLHKALCVLMGWNYEKSPANSKAYQSLSVHEARANKEDLIIWPPLVIIHNTYTIRGSDGRMKGMKNRAMNKRIIGLGFNGGWSKCLYDKDHGHQGINLIKFNGDHPYGLNTAIRLAEFFEKEKHGRKGWARAESSKAYKDKDDESNWKLFKRERKGVKNRILFGYLGTASELDLVNLDTRKNAVIVSKREKLSN
ncbi:hypothetical protein HHK36_026729 [Tetracentron sinense]|uniref:XS domain-containing protein n=1 Tax=Tetracentron sinense TaxID=13715 RepID=A0A835D2H4_TETSI|nr:hypothetical protein HHK36_026729 [Tetracentron sinense]